MNRPLVVVTTIMTLTGAVTGAIAETLDGKAPLVCAASETFDCAAARQCVADSPEGINVPRLIRIDFAAKKAFTKRLNGEDRESPIGVTQIHEGKLILQGVQGGYGWSMAISQETGAMSLTIADDGVGAVVFGTCMGL
jgi:hypothetical protein